MQQNQSGLSQGRKHTQKTDRVWFSGLLQLQHPARKRIESILSTSEPIHIGSGLRSLHGASIQWDVVIFRLENFRLRKSGRPKVNEQHIRAYQHLHTSCAACSAAAPIFPAPASSDLNRHPERPGDLDLWGYRACRWCESSQSICTWAAPRFWKWGTILRAERAKKNFWPNTFWPVGDKILLR